jgi:hypothetical protein
MPCSREKQRQQYAKNTRIVRKVFQKNCASKKRTTLERCNHQIKPLKMRSRVFTRRRMSKQSSNSFKKGNCLVVFTQSTREEVTQSRQNGSAMTCLANNGTRLALLPQYEGTNPYNLWWPPQPYPHAGGRLAPL